MRGRWMSERMDVEGDWMGERRRMDESTPLEDTHVVATLLVARARGSVLNLVLDLVKELV